LNQILGSKKRVAGGRFIGAAGPGSPGLDIWNRDGPAETEWAGPHAGMVEEIEFR